MITSRVFTLALAACTIPWIFAASACSLAHDYDALSLKSGDAGTGNGDAEASDSGASAPLPGANVQCASASCSTPSVCCVDPTAAASAEQCTTTSACTKVAVDCDDATDCGDPSTGARCCLWKENSTVLVACLNEAACATKNSFATLCDDSPAHPCPTGTCTTTEVLPGFHKCAE